MNTNCFALFSIIGNDTKNAALKKISVTCKKETEFTANQAGSSVEELKGEPFQSE